MIKKNDKKFEFKYQDNEMSFVIHDTGINLIKTGKMKNKEILDFINSNMYFTSSKFEKSFYRPIVIFNSLDIKTLDEKFFNYWSTINFNKMFSFCMNDFYKTLA